MTRSHSNMRATASLLLKLTLASLLIGWLIMTDKLDFNALARLWQSPLLLGGNLLFWGIGGVFLCGMRWWSLVQGMGFHLSRRQAVRLNLIGLFFNTIMPGVVGGDIIKAIYVCKGQARQTKMPVLLTILLDRIFGLIALLGISFLAILWNWQHVLERPLLRPFALFTTMAVCGLLVFLVLVALPAAWKEKFFLVRGLYYLVFKAAFLRKIYEAMRSYKDKPRFMAIATAYAFCHQGLYLCLFLVVSQSFLGESLQVGLLASILPIGIISTALPLAPGGLGIGHIAFERLFHLVGSEEGANIFNIIFFGQMSLNLLGVLPYLFLRHELAPLIAAEEGQPISLETAIS